MKIEELIQKEKKKLLENKIEDANLIARKLIEFVLKISRNEIIFYLDTEIEETKQKQYEKLINKIIQGIPLQYIINYQEFMKLPFYVDENVLIPQPDTEILVEEVLEIVKKENKKKILDICTGSGCIGISLANYIENCKITMSDISNSALNVATKNAKINNVEKKVKIIQSDLFEKIEETFDIIVSNPPYIETKTIQMLSKQVKNEPILALDGGEDGLLFYYKLIEQAPKYLEKNGYLCMEIGYNQKEIVTKILKENANYKNIYTKKDLSQNNRTIVANVN